MSRPPNPLASFRSYSYYHVLALCESSQAADDLAKETKIDKWLHPTSPNSNLGTDDTFGLLGSYAVKYVNEQNKTGRYCILINGATDATFTIVRAKWIAATAAEVTIMDQATSIAMEGELDISEPKGVVFLDVLVACCLGLGVDAAQAVFVLKTFFVGQLDDFPNANGTSPDQSYITDIEPLRFIATDITGTFAVEGGSYHMGFVALAHGAPRLPQYGKAASGFNFSAGESLSEAFKNLSTVVNSNYAELFDCVEATVKEPEIKQLLTRVTYQFELGEPYEKGGTPNNEYKVTDTPQQCKDKEGCDTQSKLNIPANMSIEDAIHLIMKRCPKVIDEAANGVGDEGKQIHFEYKIYSGISSVRGPAVGNTPGQLKYTIVYRVERFMRPKDVSLFELAANVGNKDLTSLTDDEKKKLTGDQQTLLKNLISFDYVYTGQNIDILEFEMKMNLGMAYMQIATINNTLKEQAQAVPTATTHVPLYERDKVIRLGQPTQIPVFFGTQIRLPSTRNAQKPSTKTEAEYTLSKHASMEVQDVTMKIYGNPRLVNTINRASSPHNIGKPAPDQNPETRQADFQDWSRFPAFAKINIKMPRNNDDISLFRGESVTDPVSAGGRDFTRDFWFTGFYYVVGIEHVFDGGEFTQTLSMIGIPQDKALKAVNKGGQNPTEDKIQTNIYKCYDSRVNPCGENFEGPKTTAGQSIARNKECPPQQQQKSEKLCTDLAQVPPGTDLELEARIKKETEQGLKELGLAQVPPGTE